VLSKVYIKLVIFDCDGVLVDSEPITNRVFADMLNDIGLPLTRADVFERFVGRSMGFCYELIEGMLERPLPQEFKEAYVARSHSALAAELKAVRHAEAVLDTLDERGVPYCVASSGTHDKMRTTLGITGLLSRLDGRLFSTTEVEHSKPAPDVYLHAARRMGVAAEHCCVVEDTPVGVAAGLAAGMRVYGYCGFTPRERLQRAGAHHTVGELCELPRLWFD
jgi:HAD superfamily hydrolase (TIGR01509 family)